MYRGLVVVRFVVVVRYLRVDPGGLEAGDEADDFGDLPGVILLGFGCLARVCLQTVTHVPKC